MASSHVMLSRQHPFVNHHIINDVIPNNMTSSQRDVLNNVSVMTMRSTTTATTAMTTPTMTTNDYDDIINIHDFNNSHYQDQHDALLMSRIAEEYQRQTHWFSPPTVTALVVAYSLVIAFGLAGNTLVVLVMLRRKALWRSSRNFYILNLSFCDLLMCGVCMPFSLVKYTLKRWSLGAVMCRVVPALATVDVFVSTFTILAIAGDRYRSIVRHASSGATSERPPLPSCLSLPSLSPSPRPCPDHERGGARRLLQSTSVASASASALSSWSSPSSSRQGMRDLPPYKVICKLVIIWTVSLALATPLFVFHSLSTERVLGKQVIYTCIEVWPHDRFREIYSVLVTLLQYLAPAAAISGLHALICNFLRRRIHDNPISESQIRRSQRELKRHRKNLILLTSIAVTFSLAWLPLTLLNLTADWTRDITVFGLFQGHQFYLAHALCLLLAMTSSVLNPLLYGWFNTNFRKAFLEILFCCPRVRRESGVTGGGGNNQESSTLKGAATHRVTVGGGGGGGGGGVSSLGSFSGSVCGVRGVKEGSAERYESFQRTCSLTSSSQ